MAATFSSKRFFNDERPSKSAVEDVEGSSFISEPSRSSQKCRTSYYFPKGVGEYHFGVRAPNLKPVEPATNTGAPGETPDETTQTDAH